VAPPMSWPLTGIDVVTNDFLDRSVAGAIFKAFRSLKQGLLYMVGEMEHSFVIKVFA
jgi:hypothetical protein